MAEQPAAVRGAKGALRRVPGAPEDVRRDGDQAVLTAVMGLVSARAICPCLENGFRAVTAFGQP